MTSTFNPSRDVISTFSKIRGDSSTYVLGRGADAVEMSRRAGTIAVDIETIGLGRDSFSVKAVTVASTGHAHILDPSDDGDRAAIIDCLRAARSLVFHNSPFDVPPLVVNGLMDRDHVWKVTDTLIAARMANPTGNAGGIRGNGLGASCERWLGEGYEVAKRSLSDRYRAQTGKPKSAMFKELGLGAEAYVNYAGFDGVMAARLAGVLPAAFAQYTDAGADLLGQGHPDVRRLYHREQVVNRMLLSRSSVGIEVDYEALDELKDEFTQVARAQLTTLSKWGVDIDLTTPKMKSDVMRVLDELGELPARYPRLQNGLPTADKRHLGKLSHPLVEALDLYSTARRFSTDYADKVLTSTIDDRIHPQVNVMVARTGRMSIGEPPLQQFPAKVRRMLRFDVPSTSLDWSSIEPVFFANVAGETSLIDAFEAGGDLYMPIAERAGVPRQTAKMVLLAQLVQAEIPG